jgi:1,2-diacylglycerol 3-beta-galactosyltransferase
MKKIHIVFQDGGGGHRNAAVALQTVIARQQRDWQVELVQFQDLTDQLDVLRKVTGIRIQQQYNILLENGWTLGSTYLLKVLQTTIRLFHGPLTRLLKKFWREKPVDLLISVIPHFNRQICQSWTEVYPGRPFVTIITDLADFPPRFWIEPIRDQYVIAGTEKAAEQARAMGHDDTHIFLTSGMILRPDFYEADDSAPVKLREEMGLLANLGASGRRGPAVAAYFDLWSKRGACRQAARPPMEDAGAHPWLHERGSQVDACRRLPNRKAGPR